MLDFEWNVSNFISLYLSLSLKLSQIIEFPR